MTITDARLRELSFLTKCEIANSALAYTATNDALEAQMVIHLLNAGHLDAAASYRAPGFAYEVASAGPTFHPANHAADLRRQALIDLIYGKPAHLRITHAGRVRRAELEEAMQSGRDRDPTNLAISKKYLERDLMVALLHASSSDPVSVAYLDMNGLKAINDESGSHAAGDAAIRAYLQVIVDHLAPGWDAYRGDSSDEVVVVMRSASREGATSAMRLVLENLQRESVEVRSARCFLGAVCGLVTATASSVSPATLLDRADKAQFRAKALSKKTPELGRPSTLAVEDGEAEVVPAS